MSCLVLKAVNLAFSLILFCSTEIEQSLAMFRQFFSQCKTYCTKPWAVSKDGVVKYESLRKQSMDGALKVMRESFFVSDNLCTAVGLLDESGAADELLKTCIDTAKDGISIVANDTTTNEIVGVIFNKIQVPAPKGKSYYEQFSKNCKYKASKAFIDFTIDVDKRVDLFKRYNSNCFLEMMYISTVPEYRHREVGQFLIKATWKLAQELIKGENVKTPVTEDGEITNASAIPDIFGGLCTTNITQHFSVKFGFDKVVEVNYEDFTFNGRKFSERIGDKHKTCTLVAKRISTNLNSDFD